MDKNEEFKKCALSFEYFAKNWIKADHPLKGLIPFDIFDFQKRLIEDYEQNRFVISTKWRNGGFTTLTAFYCLWQAIFRLDERIFWVGPRDKDAIGVNEMLRFALNQLPDWLTPEIERENQHFIKFKDTNSSIHFTGSGSESFRGFTVTKLVLDEAAFFKRASYLWKCLYPCLSCGGKCFVISTPNGDNGWFYETYQGALTRKNNFHVFASHYKEHPEFQDENKLVEMKERMGMKNWCQEMEQCFLIEQKDKQIPEMTYRQKLESILGIVKTS